MTTPLKLRAFGEHAVLLSWEPIISEKTHQHLMRAKQILLSRYAESIVEVVSSYAEIAVYLKKSVNIEQFIEQLDVSNMETATQIVKNDVVTIPVCYEAEFGWDLAQFAQQKELSEAEVVQKHTAPSYLVYFIGFLPGFPYLGGLDPLLHTPRLATPRVSVPKGSVAIGGNQTGIYPSNSPGGWNIIGKTPLSLFSSEKGSLLNAGDRVLFRAVSKAEFMDISEESTKGRYRIEREVYHD